MLAAAAIAAAGCARRPGAAADLRLVLSASAAARGGANPNLDPGSSLGGIAAPDFSLTNQFGQRISLSAFRGKVVILAFTDSECTTVCPLTTQSMLAPRNCSARRVTRSSCSESTPTRRRPTISDVMAYSRSHGLVNQWDFLTGTLPELKAVWKHYDIYVQIVKDQVDHTPALFIIDTRGREQKVYLTTMAYASITQAAQVMAPRPPACCPATRRWPACSPWPTSRACPPRRRPTLPTRAVRVGHARAGQAASRRVLRYLAH